MGHSIIKIKPSGKLPEKSNRENLPNTPPENNITKNPFEFLLTQKRIPSIHAPCVSPKASVFLLKHCNQIAQEYREQSLLNNL